jgi:hypothetical protein
MRNLFPDSLDNFNLPRSRALKNDSELSNQVNLDDILYVLNEIEKKIGCNNSADSLSIDKRINVLEGLVAHLLPIGAALSLNSTKSAVSTGGTTILFKTPISGSYIIIGTCFDSVGSIQGYIVTNQIATGFTVTPEEDGTLEWVAIPDQS